MIPFLVELLMNQKTFERREYKYLLNPDQYRRLSRYFKSRGLTPDKFSVISKNQSYYIASLYLDTADYQAYWDKQYGLKIRTKYRLRTYQSAAAGATNIYWEIKRRNGDYFHKERFPVAWAKTKQWLAGRLTLSQLPTKAINFYQAAIAKQLKPSLLISYWREPWLDPNHPNLRLTFDYRIQASPATDLFYPHRLAHVYPNSYILEIKFSGPVPGYIAEMCRVANLYRAPLSKYCRGLEACGIVSEENL